MAPARMVIETFPSKCEFGQATGMMRRPLVIRSRCLLFPGTGSSSSACTHQERRHATRCRMPRTTSMRLAASAETSLDSPVHDYSDPGKSAIIDVATVESQGIENTRWPLLQMAGWQAFVFSATVVTLPLFLRSVDSVAGQKMAIAGLAVLAIRLCSYAVEIWQKNKVATVVGLLLKVGLSVILVNSHLLYLEDYFYEFSPLVFGTGAAIAVGATLFYRFFQALSKKSSHKEKTLKGVSLDTLDGCIALRITFLTIFISSVIVVPFMEEVLFRGIYLTSVATVNAPLAVGLSGVLFSLLRTCGLAEHIFNVLLGICLGLSYVYSQGNLLQPIIAHSLFRTIGFGLEYGKVLNLAFKSPKREGVVMVRKE